MGSTDNSGLLGISKLLPFHMKYTGSIAARTLIQPSCGTVSHRDVWNESCNR